MAMTTKIVVTMELRIIRGSYSYSYIYICIIIFIIIFMLIFMFMFMFIPGEPRAIRYSKNNSNHEAETFNELGWNFSVYALEHQLSQFHRLAKEEGC